MRRKNIPFLIFAMLLLFTIPLTFDVAASVVPGWYTAILPPLFSVSLFMYGWLIIAAIAYWLVLKKTGTISKPVFIIHLLLTLPFVVFIIVPFTFEWVTVTDRASLLLKTFFYLFVPGQLLFMVYCVRAFILSPPKL